MQPALYLERIYGYYSNRGIPFMLDQQSKLKKVAIISAIMYSLLFILFALLLSDINPQSLFQAVWKSISAVTIVGAFWIFFEKKGWRIKLFRYGGWLSDVPILHGRWEGTVCRDEKDSPHPFVLEISQTFSTIKFNTYGKNARGESLSVTISPKDNELNNWIAYCVWRTTTTAIVNKTKEETFLGASHWSICLRRDDSKLIIDDMYFTSRKTKGKITVEKVSNNLKGRFE